MLLLLFVVCSKILCTGTLQTESDAFIFCFFVDSAVFPSLTEETLGPFLLDNVQVDDDSV